MLLDKEIVHRHKHEAPEGKQTHVLKVELPAPLETLAFIAAIWLFVDMIWGV